jgi:hypothetical protein
MRIEDAEIGQHVIYRPHDDAPAEDGTVTGVRDTLVMVRYWGDHQPRGTHPGDLEPGGGR